MIDEQLLRQGLQRLLKEIESAIRDRLSDEPELEGQLKQRHSAAVRAERIEGSLRGYSGFADEAITQAAVHWILGCVFVRFLEDNGWLDERNARVARIAGPGDRLAIAKDRRTLFLRPDPTLTDRDYLLSVFSEVSKLPGVAGLFDIRHNPLFFLQPTGQGAAAIVEFFQRVNTDSNFLIHDFSDPAHGTRFLGDLYQNLSESARKRYALCQTPGFVIDFILDRTLTAALDAFGLATVRMIDPSCGSGHFILEAFSRIFKAWRGKEPATNRAALAQRALDAVYGVDVNPFAVEISRFRLLIAALEASGTDRLKEAAIFTFNLAAGDSLLHGSRPVGGGIERGLFKDRLQHFFNTEDAAELKRILGRTYHVVVGNPPYKNVADAILRETYRTRYATCHGKYQLGVPFTERFFDLTVRSDSSGSRAGWVAMIVSNAFMKRSFGKKLIEDFLRYRDITHVIDTSGPLLDDYGTPTVILIARNRDPISSTLRAVRGKRGETVRPLDPSASPAWTEIRDYADLVGYDGPYISVDDVPREIFASHPWSLGGGGAAELREILDDAGAVKLTEICSEIGVQVITGEEDVFARPLRALHRAGVVETSPFITGNDIRHWNAWGKSYVFNPLLNDNPDDINPSSQRAIWFWRASLTNRRFFGKTQALRGLRWWEYSIVMASRQSPPFLAIADLATHNNAVFSESTIVFDQHAPVLKLPPSCSRGNYLELLGLLNSSVACFWLKQVCHSRGTGGVGGGLASEAWEQFYEFDNTRLKQFPITGQRPLLLSALLQEQAALMDQFRPQSKAFLAVPTRMLLSSLRQSFLKALRRMVSLQEELDWQCYFLYGLIAEDMSLSPPELTPDLDLGKRAFEIVLARQGEDTAWFERHGSERFVDLPQEWSEEYRGLVERRIAMIESNRDIALIERPEYKRRWNLPPWNELEQAALQSWLLNLIESNPIWKNHTPVSCAQLRDVLALDPDWLSVAELYEGKQIDALEAFVIKLVISEAVPFLPVFRYTQTGLRKRVEWEAVWALQRAEDAGEEVEIPVPPKYVSKDMQKSDYWRLRGGLDVPKKRFILYPSFARDSDASPVIGWAGWSHLEQAKALATYFQRMRTEEGWEPDRLKPILAGLLDLKPWLLQWHNELDPELGERLGDYFVRYTEARCQELGFSQEEVMAWQPNTSRSPQRRRRTAR